MLTPYYERNGITILELFSQVWVCFPFSFYVATMAQTNQIIKFIGLPEIVKIRETDNMMYIQLFTYITFGYITSLASIIISFPGKSPLAAPIASIILFVISTLPIIMIFATMPNVGTISRTKPKPPCTSFFGWQINVYSALFANELDARFCWGPRCNYTFPSSIKVTLLRAKGCFCSVFLERFSCKFRLAIPASVSCINFKFLGSKPVRTLTATSSLTPPFHPLGVC